MGLESKDVEKFARGCPPTQTPTQKLKSVFSTFSSQITGSSSVSLEIIFYALQSELFSVKFYSLSSKILKLPGLNLRIWKLKNWSNQALAYLFHSSIFIPNNCIIRYNNNIINFLKFYFHFQYSKMGHFSQDLGNCHSYLQDNALLIFELKSAYNMLFRGCFVWSFCIFIYHSRSNMTAKSLNNTQKCDLQNSD